jgi:hypothetical protein
MKVVRQERTVSRLDKGNGPLSPKDPTSVAELIIKNTH